MYVLIYCIIVVVIAFIFTMTEEFKDDHIVILSLTWPVTLLFTVVWGLPTVGLYLAKKLKNRTQNK